MKQCGQLILCRFCPPCLVVVLFAICTGLVTQAQEIMKVNQVLVVSKDATLIAVDAKGDESKTESKTQSSATSSPVPVSSVIRPGGRVEVSGGTSAQMIISEAVTAHLEPGTQIEIPQIVKDQQPTTSLKLLKGKMFITVDAAKLKKDGNVEFRLETPKSLLAVKGTKFVATIEEKADTVALVEGSVAVRDQATKEFATLRAGQATSVSGEGKLPIRQLTPDESKYSTAFDQSQLVFVPYQIDPSSISTESTRYLPVGKNYDDASNWVDKPNRFRAEAIKFDEFPLKGLRAEWKHGEPYQDIQISVVFKPRGLKFSAENSVGVLFQARITEPVKPLINLSLHSETKDIKAEGELMMNDELQGSQEWQTIFLANEVVDVSKPNGQDFIKWSQHIRLSVNSIRWPNKVRPLSFTIEIASIQIVTLGSEEK